MTLKWNDIAAIVAILTAIISVAYGLGIVRYKITALEADVQDLKALVNIVQTTDKRAAMTQVQVDYIEKRIGIISKGVDGIEDKIDSIVSNRNNNR